MKYPLFGWSLPHSDETPLPLSSFYQFSQSRQHNRPILSLISFWIPSFWINFRVHFTVNEDLITWVKDRTERLMSIVQCPMLMPFLTCYTLSSDRNLKCKWVELVWSTLVTAAFIDQWPIAIAVNCTQGQMLKRVSWVFSGKIYRRCQGRMLRKDANNK